MNRYVEWPKASERKTLQSFPYVERKAQDKALLKHLKSRGNCYIQGFWASGKTRFLEEAVDDLSEQSASEGNRRAVLIKVCLNEVREAAERRQSELNSKWWYLELCKEINIAIKNKIPTANTSGAKTVFDDVRRTSTYNDNNTAHEILKTYFAAVVAGAISIEESANNKSQEKIHLIIAIENIDVLFDLERSFEDTNKFPNFILNFTKVIYQVYLDKKNGDDKNYSFLSIILTGSHPLEKLDAAAYNDGMGNNLRKGLFQSAFKELSLTHFSLDELKNSFQEARDIWPSNKIGGEIFDDVERIFPYTNGYPVLTLEAIKTLNLPSRWGSVEGELVESWKVDLSIIYAWLKQPRNSNLYGLFVQVLENEPVLYNGEDESHHRLLELGLVCTKAEDSENDGSVSKRLLIHNRIFESCFRAIIEEEAAIEADAALAHNLENAAEASDVTDVTPVPFIQEPVSPEREQLVPVQPVNSPVEDESEAASSEGPGEIKPWLSEYLLSIRSYLWPADITRWGILWRLALLLTTVGGCVLLRGVVITLIPGVRESEIRKMSNDALNQFESGKQIEGLRAGIAAGKKLQQVERRRSNFRDILPFKYTELTYPQLVLQYMYSNIEQIGELRSDKYKLIHAAVSEDLSAAVAALSDTESMADPDGQGGDRAADYLSIWRNESTGEVSQENTAVQTSPVFFSTGAPIFDLSFDKTGQYLATVGKQGHVKLWDWNDLLNKTSSVEERADLALAWGEGVSLVDSVEFTPSNQYLIAQSNRGGIRAWHFEPDNIDSFATRPPIEVEADRPIDEPTTQSELSVSNYCIGSIEPSRATVEDRLRVWSVPQGLSDTNVEASDIRDVELEPLVSYLSEKGFQPRAFVYSENNQYMAIAGQSTADSQQKGFVVYLEIPDDLANLCVPDSQALLDDLQIRKTDRPVNAIAIDEQRQGLLLTDTSGSFEVISMEEASPLSTRTVLNGEASSRITLYPDTNNRTSTFLISGSESNELKVWTDGEIKRDYFSKKPLKLFSELEDAVKTTIIKSKETSSDSSDKAVGILTESGKLFALSNEFELLNDAPLQEISTSLEGGILQDIALYGSEDSVVGITDKGLVTFFDWNGSEIDSFSVNNAQSPSLIRVIPDGSDVMSIGEGLTRKVAISDSSYIRTYNRNGTLIGEPVDIRSFDLREMEFSADGRYMLLHGRKTVRVYELSQGLKANRFIELNADNSMSYKDATFYPDALMKGNMFSTIEGKDGESKITFWQIKPNIDFDTDSSENLTRVSSFELQDIRESGRGGVAKKLISKTVKEDDSWEEIAFFTGNSKDYFAIRTQQSALVFDITGLDWARQPNKSEKTITERLAFSFVADWRDIKGFGYDWGNNLIGIDPAGYGLRGNVVGLDGTLRESCEWLERGYYSNYRETEDHCTN